MICLNCLGQGAILRKKSKLENLKPTPHPNKHQPLLFELNQKSRYNKGGGVKSMDYKYTITDIQTKTNVSLQSLYKLIKKHQDFINENSTRKQRKIYYSQSAMDFFISYYQPDKTPEAEKSTPINMPLEATQTPIDAPSQSDTDKDTIDALQAQIGALQAQIDALQKQLDESEAERKELIRQNGALILTLQQEKQEKQLFLPAPKKSFVDTLKELFHKK